MKSHLIRRLCRSGAIALVLCCATAARAEPDGQMPKVWFSMGAISSPAGHQSWDTLFYQPDGTWPSYMDHVTTVGILTQALVKIPDADLAKVVARLKAKHVALGIEMLAQAYDASGCGGGVEGYFPTDQVATLAAKLKRAGAEVGYIAMDEPLWFGHYYSGKNACDSSIDNVAERVAKDLNEYLKVFPDAIVGEAEPFPSITDQPTWKEDYRHWMTAFHAKVGKPLAFTDVDINWGVQRWPSSLQQVADFARDVDLPLGIIYNAGPPPASMTNQAWLDAAVRNFTHIENTLHVVPQWAVFSSWEKYPGHALTDSYGPGEDYVLKQYLSLHR
ncbi:hypothetical protein [Paraburkholderia megapolitana]|uniref:Glycosyl hydrolase catalytic core n=1 Tax=Paraburkholderia megapolitana TaxID=420953 RepID=A0A1I3DB08_9BURK|nr:hypothetical protein [Paraburkholderia megapolitana]QDQ81760.1 hypothetical protein FNZ07_11680 [Paraburkholderia megapolitana]SFH83930.1 hypothetical protein SAMN05192543_101208 [Paraburkholderia megapolitana]